MNCVARLLIKMTHRVAYREVCTRTLANGMRFVPQWWFLWWHCYWDPIGPDFYVPRAFETPEMAREFFHDKGIFDYKE